MRVQIFLSFVFTFCLPQIGSTHDFWIEPNHFRLSENEKVEITLREGVDLKGNSLPYITDWFSDFSYSDDKGQHAVRSELGNDPAAVVTPSSGTTLLGYNSKRDFVALSAEKFATYLQQEGMEYILAQRKARGEENQESREYYVRCAKTFIQSGPSDNGSTYRRLLNYSLELMPGKDPNTLKPGEILPLQLLYLGKPIEGIRIRAFTRDKPKAIIDNRTDTNGKVQLSLPRKGIWLIKAVHMVPINNDPKAHWESFWASLLFELH